MKMNYFFAFFMASLASLAAAQTLAPAQAQKVEIARDAVADPSLTSVTSSGRPQITLVSSQDKTNATAEAGVRNGDLIFSVRVQAPISKSDDPTKLVNLNGLPSGASASIGVTRISLGSPFGFPFNPNAVGEVCEDYNATIALQPPIDVKGKQCSADALKTRGAAATELSDTATRVALKKVCLDMNKSGGGAFIDIDSGQCTEAAILAGGADWAAALKAEAEKQLNAACEEFNSDRPKNSGRIKTAGVGSNCSFTTLKAKGESWAEKVIMAEHFSPTYASFRVTTGNDTFKYADDTTLARHSVSKSSAVVEASYGRLFGLVGPSWYGAISGRAGKLYEGASPANLCEPFGAPGTLKCSNIALAAPTQSDVRLVIVEGRKFFGKNFAINPRLGREFKKKVTTGNLVAYFLADPKEGLNGGVDVGYASDHRHITVQVFIGAVLRAFGG